jgi:hypothetical protein
MSEKVLKRLSNEIEEKGYYIPLIKLFQVPESLSISVLSMVYVQFLFYFRESKFSFKEITSLMATDQTRYKQIFRRMYQIASYLEEIGIVRRIPNKTVFILTEYAESCAVKIESTNFLSIENLLNRPSKQLVSFTYKKRAERVLEAVAQKNYR